MRFLNHIISIKSNNKEIQRIHFILSVLLSFAFLLGMFATSYSLYEVLFTNPLTPYIPPYVVLSISLTLLPLLYLSKIGKPRLSASIFISLLLIPTLYMSVVWGSLVPQGVAMYALVVVLAGILIHSLAAVALTVVLTAILVPLSYSQYNGWMAVEQSWQLEPFGAMDAAFFGITMGVIAVVTWLSNREIERALHRAETSEQALRKEQDSLDKKVRQRTQELKQAQLEKMVQLNRFVDVGRMAAGLLHDVTTPLTVISVSLDELNTQPSQADQTQHVLKRATAATTKLERFVKAARKQLQPQTIIQVFSIEPEVRHVFEMLRHKARAERVQLRAELEPDLALTGDPVKFFQIMLNLVSNAIDAYHGTRIRKRLVTVTAQESNHQLVISVTDRGPGIPAKVRKKIFEPFFTTKTPDQGTGIGLSITKQSVEEDFRGRIKLSSTSKATTFTLYLPLKGSS